MSINKTFIQGRLTADPEVKKSNDGREFITFTVAVDGYKDSTEFFDCIANGPKVKFISEHYKKGNIIGVEGHFSTREWTDKNNNKRKDITLNVDSVGYSHNDVVVTGRLTKDPELKDTAQSNVANFSIAVQRDYKDSNGEYPTDFIDIQAWRGTADFVGKYFKKGMPITVAGDLRTRDWTDENGNKRRSFFINADQVDFAHDKEQKQEKAQKKTTTVIEEVVNEEEELLPWEQSM